MYKKLFIGIIGAMVLFALSGCGSNSDVVNSTREETAAATTVIEQNLSVNSSTSNEAPTNNASSDNTRSRYLDVPEGYEIATPPTEVQIGLANGTEIPLIVSGTELAFDGQRPIIKNGEVFVPLFGVFEHMVIPANWQGISSFTTTWDEQTSTVTIRNSVAIVTITAGDTTLSLVNVGAAQPLIMPSSPIQRTLNGELMLPLMPVAEALMACVVWDDNRGQLHLFFSSYIVGGMGEDGEMISIRPINPYIQ